jgi:hypothetical protein
VTDYEEIQAWRRRQAEVEAALKEASEFLARRVAARQVEEAQLAAMSVKRLRQLAVAAGCKRVGRFTKVELVALLLPK